MLFSVILILAALFCYIMGTLNFLHMFQLNSYKPKEQLKWYGKNAAQLVPCAVVIAAAAVCFALPVKLAVKTAVTCAAAVICAIALRPRKAKKPLVYTPRVKRLLTTCGAVYILAAAAMALAGENAAVLIAGLVSGLTPALLLLCNYINKPIELSINRHYINDAKRILRECPELTVIGVTGSFGKTSVKFYLNTLLRAKFNVLMTPESYNTPLGIVKTIRGSLKASHDVFICEMGARNVGDIKEICDIVHPKHGVITSVGEQHLETFKTLENIANTKFELADSLPDGGMLFVNGDSPAAVGHKHPKMTGAFTYGLGEGCGYRATDLRISEKGSEFTVTTPEGESCGFVTKLIGSHNVINIVGAIAVSHKLGIPLEKLRPQVRRLECVPHRLQLINRSGIIMVDDAYNSNPSGARAALETISMFDGMKILVTPGMVELGQMQQQCNYEFGREAAQVCDYIILVGEKQTQPIYQGVSEAGFDMGKCYVAHDLNDAISHTYSLKSDKKKIVLLENDLPDNY